MRVSETIFRVTYLSMLNNTGNIASIVVMDVFTEKFGVAKQTAGQYANTKGWIVSIATAGAVFGCLSVRIIDTMLRRLS